MKTLARFLHCDGSTDRQTYLHNIVLLAAGKLAIDLQVMPLRPDLFSTWSWPMMWLDPFVLLGPWSAGVAPMLVCCTTVAFCAALAWNSVHRARNIGVNKFLGLLSAVPFVNALAVPLLMILPGKRHSVFDLS